VNAKRSVSYIIKVVSITGGSSLLYPPFCLIRN
jgi:hypothetical protein